MLLLMLLLSLLLGLVSVAGVAWIIIVGSLLSVDGLFMSLILLTLSGVFLLNGFLDLRDRGLLALRPKKKVELSKQPPSSTAG